VSRGPPFVLTCKFENVLTNVPLLYFSPIPTRLRNVELTATVRRLSNVPEEERDIQTLVTNQNLLVFHLLQAGRSIGKAPVVIEEVAGEEEGSKNDSDSDDNVGSGDGSGEYDNNWDNGEDGDELVGDDAVVIGSSSIPSPMSEIMDDITERQRIPLEEGEISNLERVHNSTTTQNSALDFHEN